MAALPPRKRRPGQPARSHRSRSRNACAVSARAVDSRAVDSGGPCLWPGMGYIGNMYIAIEFNPAAFKHGVSEAGIRFAILNALYDDVLDDTDNKHLALGFDNNGNLLEILYNIIDEDSINVFHAMSCRNIFLPLLEH